MDTTDTTPATEHTTAPDEDTTSQPDPTADETTPPDPADPDTHEDADRDDDGDTFPRAYVEKLRAQNARYRERSRNADELAHRLHTELVRATGRLADPGDLEFDPEHLADADTLTTAIDALLAAKPHLASRRPTGEIGQGQRSTSAQPVSLLDILKAHT